VSVLLIVLGILLVMAGLLGAVLPYLPGLPLAFLGTILLGYGTEFGFFSVTALWVFGGIALASLVCDYLAGFLGARWGKASIWGTVGALLGTILGIGVFGIGGVIIGPALGVLLFEMLARRDHLQAARAARSTLLSSILGLATNAFLALAFVITLTLVLIF